MSGEQERPATRPERPRAAARSQIAPRSVFSLSEEETADFGRTLGRQVESGTLILLTGDLGAGKTVFVRGMASGLGIEPEDVGSPSFRLIHEYKGGRLTLFHVDLYRIETGEELATLGLDELFDSDGVVVVEWGERLPPVYRRDALSVEFHDVGEGSRRIELITRPEEGAVRPGDA